MTTNKKTVIWICVAVAVLLVGIAAGLFFYMTADDGLILNNVFVGNVNIGGKSQEEAKTLLQRQTDLTYPYEDMVVELPGETLRLSPADTGVVLDIDGIIEEAYRYGRTGSYAENKAIREAAETMEFTIALLDYLTLDTDYIQSQLDAYEQANTSEFAESSVTVTGDMPALDSENFDPEAPTQTITVEIGNPGRQVDMEGVYDLILAAYGANEFLVTVELSIEETLPEAVDLTQLYEQTYVAPVDATMDSATHKIASESYGYDFDLEAAQALIAEASYGDVLSIPYRYIEPEWLASELEGSVDSSSSGLFKDVLASYKTPHTSSSNRNTNLRLACAAINGTVLMPGQQFDYNTTLGKRTEAKGYKAAGAYVNGATVDTIGGGICQVSSTLYYCTLLADLQIDARRAHSYVSTYMPLGMDAAVSWGGPEFRFTNNTGYPIKIEAWVSGGYVNVKLLGTNTKDYYVKMEYEVLSTTEAKTEYKVMTSAEAKAVGYYDGQVIQSAYTGKSVKSYKCKYDSATGKLISRTFEASSTYRSRNKIVVDIQNSTTTPSTTPTTPTTTPTTKPTTAPTTTPTTKPTTAPTTTPTTAPTTAPTTEPTTAPTTAPTQPVTEAPTTAPSEGEG